MNVLLEDKPYTLASVYVPNEKQLQYIDEVLNQLQAFSSRPIILGGDLNCVANRGLDYSGPRKTGKILADPLAAKTGICKQLQKYNLGDVWRHLNPGVRDYTHHSQQYAED